MDWTFDPEKDVDMRGRGSNQDALEEAFKRTGEPKENFEVSKWGKTEEGKTIPVEWESESGANVNIPS